MTPKYTLTKLRIKFTVEGCIRLTVWFDGEQATSYWPNMQAANKWLTETFANWS